MLSIPEPCNEDFSKMTPTERGAFCSKCQIDTFDFKDLSDLEVNRILLKHKDEHLCGQFTTKQLNSLNRGYLNWKNQKESTFRSKFVLALVLVFGLSLFSCNTQEEKAIIELQSLELIHQPETRLNYVNESFANPDLSLVDYVAEIEPEAVPTVVLEQVLDPVEIEMDSELPECTITANTKGYMTTTTGGVPVMRMRGGAVANVSYVTYLEDTITEVKEESTLPEPVINEVMLFETKAFPNPTTSNATLQLNVEKEGQFEIRLFNMAGSFVQHVYSGELLEGEQRFEIELADQPSGMYIVNVIAEGHQETIKIQKMN